MAAAHPVVARFTLAHVKSHQDDKTEFDDLPFSAQLNVLCDKMATAQLQCQRLTKDNAQVSLCCPLTPRNLPVEIFYRHQVTSSHYVSILRDEIGLDRHRQFSKQNISGTTRPGMKLPGTPITSVLEKPSPNMPLSVPNLFTIGFTSGFAGRN
jgi:hypothetical protein